jgi:hypothetical protein
MEPDQRLFTIKSFVLSLAAEEVFAIARFSKMLDLDFGTKFWIPNTSI